MKNILTADTSMQETGVKDQAKYLKFQMIIEDSGVGISKENIAKLF